jgi:hypothetical protein
MLSTADLKSGVATAAQSTPQGAAWAPAGCDVTLCNHNWGAGGPNGFPSPGTFAQADPAAHYQWYKDLGVNVIQTFCVSCNDYARYQGSEVAPVQPGLRHDFLKQITELAHTDAVKVMGYFCVGANTYWGQKHPEQSYGIPSGVHIPFTSDYLDYLAGCIQDALTKTGIDGFMIDWAFSPPLPMAEKNVRWLPCEQKMYAELFNRPFPGQDRVDARETLEFQRRALERCWRRLRQAAKSAKHDCVIWLSCFDLSHPQVVGTEMLREVDWVMNETPTPEKLDATRQRVGPHARLIQCVSGGSTEYDALVLGERAPRRWMAGSHMFSRTQNAAGQLPLAPETARTNQWLQIAAVYRGKQIEIWREGQRYAAYEAPNQQPHSTDSDLYLGLRCIFGQQRYGFLAGAIAEARLYDTALDGDTYFPRFFHTAPKGPLLNHFYTGGPIYAAPLKALDRDHEGILRLVWWPGNEKLKSARLPVTLRPPAGPIQWLGGNLDVNRTVALEGTVRLAEPVAGAPALRGLGIDQGNDTAQCVCFERTQTLYGDLRLAAQPLKLSVRQRANRDLNLGPRQRFRILLHRDMLEVYVNDYLTVLTRVRNTGRLGLLTGKGPGEIENLRIWRSANENQRPKPVLQHAVN